MNGYDIYKKAIKRAGISSGNVLSDDICDNAKEFINQIAQDLKLSQISSLRDEIDCTNEFAEVLCCGVAMLITLSISDMDKNRIYTDIYNSKRAAVLSEKTAVEDVLPTPSYGGE